MAEAELITSPPTPNKKFILILFYLLSFLLIIAFNFTDNPVGWYQQNLPDLNNMPLSDFFFLDSLTGYAVTDNNTSKDTGYIIKTTNGGDNWNIIYKNKRDFSRIKFLNQNTGFVCGGSGSGTSYLIKTTNAGLNWNAVNVPDADFFRDMSVLNENTIWLVDNNSLLGGVYRTTNGGNSWVQQYSAGTQNPSRIYMYNSDTGYTSNNSAHRQIMKTTNGGFNWVLLVDSQSFSDIHFINSLTGWRTGGSKMFKTTDGGISWITQFLPSGLLITDVYEFSILNKDTIWAVGGVKAIGNQSRGVVYRTTNSGNVWQYQVPDTAINIYNYYHIQTVNKNNCWAYFINKGIHTTTGGDPQWTDIKEFNTKLPQSFILHQNYPNPFNPVTKINFEIPKDGKIKLIVYDLLGREMTRLVNNKLLKAGKYIYEFNGSNLASGVYFYRLVTDDLIQSKKMILLK